MFRNRRLPLFHGAIYQPPREGLPLVAVIFKGNAVVGVKVAASVAEADLMIAEAVEALTSLEPEPDA